MSAGEDGAAPRQVVFNRLTLQEHTRKQANQRAAELGRPLPSPTPAVPELPQESALPQVDIEALKARGRTFYLAGEYAAAVEAFRQIVSVSPDDVVARDYLVLAEERARSVGSPAEGRAGGAEVEAVEATPNAAVTVSFHCPLRQGKLLLWVDGHPLPPLELTSGKRKGGFHFEHRFSVPDGRHTVEVQLEGEQRAFDKRTFSEEFAAGAEWTLGLTLSSAQGELAVFLVRRAQSASTR